MPGASRSSRGLRGPLQGARQPARDPGERGRVRTRSATALNDRRPAGNGPSVILRRVELVAVVTGTDASRGEILPTGRNTIQSGGRSARSGRPLARPVGRANVLALEAAPVVPHR